MENSIIDRNYSSAKLLIMQNYTDNTNGALIVENVIFLVSLNERCIECRGVSAPTLNIPPLRP